MCDEEFTTQTPDTTEGPKKRCRESTLPPCDICGQKASGLHYGVNSCEACKAFFYRNADRVELLTCDSGRKCEPEAGFGYKCPACRMKKCLEFGMSRTVFKKGRYSYERKAGLRRTNISACNKETFLLYSQTPSPDAEVTSPIDIPDTTARTLNDYQTFCTNQENRLQINRNKGTNGPTAGKDDDNSGQSNMLQSCACRNHPFMEAYSRTITPSADECAEVIGRLNELYARYPQYPQEFFGNVKGVQKRYLETKNEERRIFGPMRPLPVAEFLAVYHKTGIDLDGRLESIRSSFQMFEYACLIYVQYAQDLPGFEKFGEEDKTSILKGAKSSFWMLADYTTLDLESGLWTWPNYETFDKEGMSIRWFEPYYKKLFEIAEKLQKLHLTAGEENVLRAIVLFNPDICVTLEGKRHAAQERFILLQVLHHLTSLNHPMEPDLLEKLSEIEREMVNFNHEDSISTKFQWSLYENIFRAEKSINVPIMRLLYNLPPEK